MDLSWIYFMILFLCILTFECDRYFQFLSGNLSDIYSDIPPGILSDILFGILSDIFLAFYLTFYPLLHLRSHNRQSKSSLDEWVFAVQNICGCALICESSQLHDRIVLVTKVFRASFFLFTDGWKSVKGKILSLRLWKELDHD